MAAIYGVAGIFAATVAKIVGKSRHSKGHTRDKRERGDGPMDFPHIVLLLSVPRNRPRKVMSFKPGATASAAGAGMDLWPIARLDHLGLGPGDGVLRAVEFLG